jgi:hypothetical protein
VVGSVPPAVASGLAYHMLGVPLLLRRVPMLDETTVNAPFGRLFLVITSLNVLVGVLAHLPYSP